jgi:hypothetical protein
MLHAPPIQAGYNRDNRRGGAWTHHRPLENFMSKNKNLGGENVEEKRPSALERLREEITVLRIEGTLFCFDPKEAKRRRGIITNTLKDADGTERPVSVHIHPDFGQPSVLAYKIGQAVFLKMTEAGEPYPNAIAFTQRELARLVGRAWGTSASQQLYHALMQLQNTRIICSVHNKETKEYLEMNFFFLPTVLFSNKNKMIAECVVQVHDAIVTSLNRNHAIWLNYEKLRTLDTIGMVFYKRLFFHLSNTYRTTTMRSTFKFEKDYEDICREWLGGLKPEKYKSRIDKQLGKYLESVKATGLISRFEILPRVRGTGFKLVFYPGVSFYDDYQEFYLRTSKRTAQLPERTASNPQPLQLVAYFHELLGRSHKHYSDKERGQAAELLKLYSDEEARALIEHAVAQAKKTNFQMQFFGAVLSYRDSWLATRVREACAICHGQGTIVITDQDGIRARVCTHGKTAPNSESLN